MNLSGKKIKAFQDKILTWYNNHKRDFPWRQTRDPYAILISEVMSQQTQINRVVLKYELWMRKFPTVEHLAKASVADVLAYWSGLGYNRRALNLKKTAEMIAKDFNGTFPKTEEELLALPGIGKYTARAILCFAFDQQVTVVDTNIRKVIITQFGLDGSENELQNIADQLLPNGKAYDWNQALMDYAAAVLKNEKISIPKQSKFIGSHRYYRGQILKYLLKHKEVIFDELGLAIKKEYTQAEKVWLEKLVQELIDEGFITMTHQIIRLTS